MKLSSTAVNLKEMSAVTDPLLLLPLRPAWVTLFTEQTAPGLFAAIWLGKPADPDLAPLDELAISLLHGSGAQDELRPVLGHLLAVQKHCLRAARTSDPSAARSHYGAALASAESLMSRLHDATAGTARNLMRWVEGVHTLIQAQGALPDLERSKALALKAVAQLTDIGDPLCEGSRADCGAAVVLASEPSAVATALERLPMDVEARVHRAQEEIAKHESVLNHRLAGVHHAYDTTFKAVVVWGAINLALMATLPLNGAFFSQVAWSLPFMVAVPVLWWWTWSREFRDGFYFFEWVRETRDHYLALFHEAAAAVPDSRRQFQRSAHDLLMQARTDQERLRKFCLGELPPDLDTVAAAEMAIGRGDVSLAGEWQVVLDDRHPWKLTDMVPVKPTMAPHAIRVWYGQ